MKKLNKDDLEKLPKKKYGDKNHFDWSKIGEIKPEIRFTYDDVSGKVKIIKYEKSGQKLTIEYNGTQFSMKTGEFLKCSFGSLLNKLNKTIIEGVNDIYSQESWMIKFFVNPEEAKKYSKGMRVKIKVKCPICNTIKDKKVIISNLYRNKSIGCLKCGDGISYPNKFCFNLLKQLNIKFEAEYTPNWLNNMRYDFFIPSLNLIIEMDGGFHNSNYETKISDEYKNMKAIENNVELIRIDCSKSDLYYIKESIINSRLSEIFSFENIDWLEIEEFCLSSMVKEICDLWKKGNNVKEIVSITGLCKTTVCKYLNKGSKLDWCNYNGKEQKIKNWEIAGIKTGKKLSKKVEVFKDGMSLGVFDNCREVERKSEELFGLKLNNKHISAVCNGRRKAHKGFTFQHVT